MGMTVDVSLGASIDGNGNGNEDGCDSGTTVDVTWEWNGNDGGCIKI